MKNLKLLGVVLALLLAASAVLLWLSHLGAGGSTAWENASSLEEWGRMAYKINHPVIASLLLVVFFGLSFLLANYLGKLLGGLLGLVTGILIGWKRFKTVAFALGLATGLCVVLVAQLLSATYKFPNPVPWLLLASVIGWRIWKERPKLSSGTTEQDRQVESWHARGHVAGMIIMSLRWILSP